MKEKITKILGGRGFDYFVVFLFLAITIVMFRGVLFGEGVVGMRHDWSVPQTSDAILMWHKQALQPWLSARGGFTISYLSDYLVRLTVGLLGYVGMNGGLLSKLYLVICSWMTGIFSYIFLKHVAKNKVAALVGALFYMINPLTFNKYIAGHINYWIAYALSPMFALSVIKVIEIGNFKSGKYWWWTVLAGVLFAVSGVQLQFLIMLSIVYLILMVVYKAKIIESVLSYLVIGIIGTMMHLPWLGVLFLEMIYYKSSLAVSPTTLSGMIDNASNIYQAIIMTGNNSDYFMNSLLTNNLLTYWLVGMAGMLIVVSWGVWKKKNRLMLGLFGFWLLGVLMLSFYRLFPDFSFMLLNSAPVFNFFREVYHLTFLTVFVWTILVVLSWNAFDFNTFKQRIIKYLIVICLFILFWPVLIDGKLMGNLQLHNLPTNDLVNESGGASWYLPGIQPFTYEGIDYAGFDSTVYYAEGGALSQMGRYSPLNERFATFANGAVFFDTENISAVLDRFVEMMGVDRIIYREKIESSLPSFTLLSRYERKASDFSNDSIDKLLEVWEKKKEEVKEGVSRYVFDDSKKIIVGKPCVATGEWEDYFDIFGLVGPAECDTVIDAGQAIDQDLSNLNAPIIFNDNNWFDLMLADTRVKKIELGSVANQEWDLQEGWVSSERAWWYDPAVVSYPELAALTLEDGAELEVDLNDIEKGDYKVFIEILESNVAGKIDLEFKDYKTSFENRNSTKNWKWFEVGDLVIGEGENVLKITNVNGDNVLGQLILVERDVFDELYLELVERVQSSRKIVLSDFEKISQAPGYDFDFTKNGFFYENFPEYSSYDFETSENNLAVNARFGGGEGQNEFATVIYDLKDYDLNLTPVISFYNDVENVDVGFWEMALEIDEDNDKQVDYQLWLRLKHGLVDVSVNDFFVENYLEYNAEKHKILGMRLQPHKEYGVDMANYVDKEYVFVLSDMKFTTENDVVLRLPRMARDYDLDVLKDNKILSQDLSSNVALYNDIDSTIHELVEQNEKNLKIKSLFGNEDEESEFATLIVDTNVNIFDYSYMTVDLQIDDIDWQFYDLALMIDSDYDNYIDEEIWLDSVMFDNELNKTLFVDMLAQLQKVRTEYYNPRLLGLKILPHRQYEVSGGSVDVNFGISDLNFYHDGSLNLSEKNNVSVMHTNINAPQTANYDMYVRLKENSVGELQMVLDGKMHEIEVDRDDMVRVGVVSMAQGDNDVVWLSDDKKFVIDDVILFNVGEDFGDFGENEVVSYDKENSVRYSGELTMGNSGLVLFKESFHPAWSMNLIDKETGEVVKNIRPILVNGWEQGYFVDEIGEYDFEIVYELSGIYRWLLGVTGVSVLLLTIFLVLLVPKERKALGAIKAPSNGKNVSA